MSRGRITVVGLDGRPLDEGIERLLANAALVAGGGRHLEMLGVHRDRAVVLEGDLSEALARIEGTEGPVVVLASGDPGFFGIVRLLGERPLLLSHDAPGDPTPRSRHPSFVEH